MNRLPTSGVVSFEADAFLRLLVDQIRPELAAQYRFTGEHALLGHSAGGMFAAYSLFTRPAAFQKMIIDSPCLEGVNGAVFAAEARYAADHNDLKVRLLVGAGEKEAEAYCVAIAGKDHYTVLPDLIISGIGYLWREETPACRRPGRCARRRPSEDARSPGCVCHCLALVPWVARHAAMMRTKSRRHGQA